MTETPGSPEYYTPPDAAPPEVPQPPSISDAAAQWDAAQAGGDGQAAYQAQYTPQTAYPAGQPYAYAPPPTGPGRPQGLAITALVIGLVAFFIGWVPVAGFVVGVVAVIFGITALVKKQSKGMAITGLIAGVLGAVTSAALVAFIVLSADSDYYDDYDDYTYTNPDPQETIGAQPSDGGLYVSEQAFDVASWDDTVTWFAVVLTNPADGAYPSQLVTVNALDAAGEVVDSYETYPSLAPGESAITGMFYDLAGADVASIEVLGPDAGSLSADTGPRVEASGVVATADDYFTTVTGTVTAVSGDSDYGSSVVVLARDESGTIIDYGNGYVDALAEGESAEFSAMFYEVLPEGTTYTAYASSY